MQLFFQQFEDSVSSKLDTLKQPILKELREYVQIASWKDVNVFALKESAKRTHYHLNKIVKKFRAVLSISIKDVIAQYHEVAPIAPNALSPNLQSTLDKIFLGKFVCGMEVPDCVGKISENRLLQSEKLFKKAQAFNNRALDSSCSFQLALTVEDFTEEIISRISNFQSQTFSNGNLKGLKGQKMVRKKAWSDLLKHLAHIGLSPRYSHRYVLQQDIVYMNTLCTPV